MALDSIYSFLENRLPKSELERILGLLCSLGFEMFHEGLLNPELMDGLMEFREHLGGRLTVMLLEKIGQGVEVHHIDPELVLKSVNLLQEFQTSHCLDL
jgi:3-dehydroquinate synthase